MSYPIICPHCDWAPSSPTSVHLPLPLFNCPSCGQIFETNLPSNGNVVVTGPKRPKPVPPQIQSPKEYNFGGLLWAVALFFASFIIIIGGGGGGSGGRKTDGVFESAMQKIDSGRASRLTETEAQRVDDIMNWCSTCGKPLRNCRHGK